ncbi:hypothetical protein ACHWQZ_G010311 [Mnemiopsis leidyi]
MTHSYIHQQTQIRVQTTEKDPGTVFVSNSSHYMIIDENLTEEFCFRVPCTAGQFWNISTQKCDTCGENTISREGATECDPCPTGIEANQDNTQCESCVGLKETWTNIETKTIFPARPGTKITLTCGEGYQLLGDDVITCQLEREFSFKNQPQCTIKICTRLPEIPNLSTDSPFPINYGALVTVYCKEGYKHQGDQILGCKENQDFNFETSPICVQKQCTGLPNEELKTDAIFPVNYGSHVTVSCDPDSNIELRGDDVITCTESQIFLYGEKPRCNDIGTCSELPIGKNLITDSTFPVIKGSLVYLGCQSGYTFTSGDRVITCAQDSEYSFSEEPVCSIDVCTGLPDIYNLKTTTQFPVDHGSQVRIDCIFGYKIVGDQIITCIKGRTFNFNAEPQCVLNECTSLPSLPKIETDVPFPVVIGTKVKVKCKEGHKLQGDDVITCVNGTLFNITVTPTCTVDICRGILVANDLLNNGTYPMEYGTAVSVWCRGSLKLVGDDVVYCQEGINYDYTYRPACVDPSKFKCDNVFTLFCYTMF